MKSHGTNSMYATGCRCDACREAHMLDARARRGSKARAITHGREYAYREKHCRCEECVRWKRSQIRVPRRKPKATKPAPTLDLERYQRICQYADILAIPLADAANVVDRMARL